MVAAPFVICGKAEYSASRLSLKASDPMESTIEEIERFATKLERAGERVFKFACNTELKLGGDDPKVIAVLLLIRTLSNFRGTLILLRADRIVEARTIARCCFENRFTIAALSKDGQRLISEMRSVACRLGPNLGPSTSSGAAHLDGLGPDSQFLCGLSPAAALRDHHSQPQAFLSAFTTILEAV
jgi:hypothetical protein